jgi:hypothetical protein
MLAAQLTNPKLTKVVLMLPHQSIDPMKGTSQSTKVAEELQPAPAQHMLRALTQTGITPSNKEQKPLQISIVIIQTACRLIMVATLKEVSQVATELGRPPTSVTTAIQQRAFTNSTRSLMLGQKSKLFEMNQM